MSTAKGVEEYLLACHAAHRDFIRTDECFCLIRPPIGTPVEVKVIEAVRVDSGWCLALLPTVLRWSPPYHLVKGRIVTLRLIDVALAGRCCCYYLNRIVLLSSCLLEQFGLKHYFVFETLSLQLDLVFVETQVRLGLAVHRGVIIATLQL